ncbi:hypothetical protein OWR29_26575 [Actinoplanes sp. Pm04-4]|uniref:Transcriptional regulator n=1 Tax=Paractinoplanes pyxinae TaxID=2997416 RepID=A0ABT4B500_9ACTN|nr:hypothetical protein [Actinoplanes pyxinae]MCY1141578.1 hypothetical protein [Actinoplanes pyxinae]
METDLDDDPVTSISPIDHLRAETELLINLFHDKCDYIGLGQRLPGVLRALHAMANSNDREEALRLTVRATHMALLTLRSIGRPAETWLAAERCRRAAEQLEDPVLLTIAGHDRAYAAFACGTYARGATLAANHLAEAGNHLDSLGGYEAYGQLLLTTAYGYIAVGRSEDSEELIREAERVAKLTGETGLRSRTGELVVPLHFGPTNVKFWRISAYADGEQEHRAVRLALETTPDAIQSMNWKGGFYQDLGKAMARVGRSSDSLMMLLSAERIAPLRTRSSPIVRETARSLAEHGKFSDRRRILALCERLGLSVE